MKSSDRAILMGVFVVGLLAAFWFLILTPKREQVSELDTQIAAAKSELSSQEALVQAGQEAKDGYASDYQRLVVLGKAVPGGDDAASLFVEFNDIAERSKVDFTSITLGSTDAAAPAPAPATLTEADPPADAASAPTDGSTPDAAAADASAVPAAVPTEAAASTLPLGASVGSAGLPVIPYHLELAGGFFGFADFFHGVDELVTTGSSGVANSGVSVDGRLVTINGFDISIDDSGALIATLEVSTYVSPLGQGVTGGATAAAPAATTVAAPAPTASPAPAATVTP